MNPQLTWQARSSPHPASQDLFSAVQASIQLLKAALHCLRHPAPPDGLDGDGPGADVGPAVLVVVVVVAIVTGVVTTGGGGCGVTGFVVTGEFVVGEVAMVVILEEEEEEESGALFS